MKIVQIIGTFDPITKSDVAMIANYHQKGYQVYLKHQHANDRSTAILKVSLKYLSYIIYGESINSEELVEVVPCLIDEHLFGKLNYNALKLAQKNAYYYGDVLSTKMTQKRYEHSLSVAKLAKSLAIKHNLDPSRAYLMGLVHDVTKELNQETEKLWMSSYYASEMTRPQALYHQYTAEYYLKKQFRIMDQSILNAVKSHTTGTASDCYAMILYVADKLEIGRNYECETLIQLAYKNIYRGFKAVKTAQKDYLSLERIKND